MLRSPPRLRTNNASPWCPRHHPLLSLASHPGCPAYTRGWWDAGPVLFLRPGSVILYLARPRPLGFPMRHPSPRVMRETRPDPGDAGPCLAPELLRVTFTGKSRAWCETGADAPFTSAAAPGSGPSYRRMAAGKPGELRTPGPWLRQLETLKWSNTPSLQQSHHSFSSQLSGVAVGQRNIFGERHHSRCHHQIIFSKSSEACDNTRHR